jgi:gluconate 2-dehydrogenase
MKPKVLIYKEIPEEVLAFIQESFDVDYFDKLKDFTDSNFRYALKQANGLLGSGLPINKELLDLAPQLRIVSNISVGYNNFDIEELNKRGIMATNTPDVLTNTTADLMFGLLLSAARRIAELNMYVKKGNWTKHIGQELFGVDVHNKTLGIIGMGRIGSAIAKRANLGFDMKILYHNRSANEQAEKLYEARRCELDELLEASDFVCLMTPLTNKTKHLMDEREFNLMKHTAIFINGSRGETVNEKALVQALQNGRIRGAGLDVYQQEPVEQDHPLLQLSQVVTLPHIGSATQETRTKMAWLAAENIAKGLKNDRPPSLINKLK